MLKIIAAVLLSTAAILAVLYIPQKGESYLRVLSVGHGDAIMLSSRGKTMLIDSGPPESAERLSARLKSYGVTKIDTLLLTHFHNDHSGGSAQISQRFKIKNIIYPNVKKSMLMSAEAYLAMNNAVNKGAEFDVAYEGMKIRVGEFLVSVIAYFDDMSIENNRSLILMIECKGFKFLSMADAETSAEKRLINQGTDLKCNVIKIGHHGSSSSSGDALIVAAAPQYAVVSCGENISAYPSAVILDRINRNNISILRTDLCGDILFEIGDKGYETECEKSLYPR